MKNRIPRFALCVATTTTLLLSPCSALADSGLLGGLLDGLFVKKERSFLNVRGGITFMNIESRFADPVENFVNEAEPVLSLDLNAAPSRYFNLELGVGGYHDKVPDIAWNHGLSHVVAGSGYLIARLFGGKPTYSKMHDALEIPVKNSDTPYSNTSLSAGAFIVPFPTLRVQPQLGVQMVRVSVDNKGSDLRSYEHTSIMPAFGLENRAEFGHSGIRVMAGQHGGETVLEGLKIYFGMDI